MRWLDAFFASRWPLVLLGIMALISALGPGFACSARFEATPSTVTDG